MFVVQKEVPIAPGSYTKSAKINLPCILFFHVTCHFWNQISSYSRNQGQNFCLAFRWAFSELRKNLIHKDMHVDNNR